MQIQVNSDKNITVDAGVVRFVESEVSRVLKRFSGKLTRVEVHLSDVNSHKFGTRDKRCLIEARPARHRAITASSAAATVRAAVKGALTKLRSSLETVFGRLGKAQDKTALRAKRSRPRAEKARPMAATAAASANAAGDEIGSATPQRPARGPKKTPIHQARRKSWPAR